MSNSKPAAEWVRIGDLLPWERNPKARFNDHMRAQGYAKLETGFWNNRPVVWVRQ